MCFEFFNGSIPTGIAACERTFSALRRIMPWSRCRLGKRTVDMLMFVWINYRLIHNDFIECDENSDGDDNDDELDYN